MIENNIKLLEEKYSRYSYGKTDWLSPGEDRKKQAGCSLDTALGFPFIELMLHTPWWVVTTEHLACEGTKI